ncbi:carbon-nitrogen hydrolase family protein [Cryptosporangium phraense]|uniref:Carbon-nitrogen hydrolase family protein n=1 Tax=Cryptosporangium phraense TaxID=2593070 RepID=A0A545AMP5_9ACTN|nr:carbon-nitrogen hydrolase family protein [Cryptosporangium phraense]TQS42607.1 carbon-nitrogen hydrolase family protein [Cryptosporangium phraense]
MSEILPVAAAQPRLVSFDVDANVRAHADVVRTAGARVVVFPEMSLTGYEFEAPPLDPDDSRLAPLVAACAGAGAIALAGAPVGGHIAMLAVDGSGARVAYRKQYLGDAEPYTPGPAPAVLTVDGWRLGLAICKDTGVAAHAADTVALGVDAYVAGVLEDSADVPAGRAERIASEHRVWVVIASYAGSTGGGYEYAAGGSGVWAPGGGVVARAGARPGDFVRATLTRR